MAETTHVIGPGGDNVSGVASCGPLLLSESNGSVWEVGVLASDLAPEVDYVLGGLLLITALISVSGNMLVLVTMTYRRREAKPVELFVFNMALCDVIQSFVCLPVFASAAFNHGWQLGTYMCIFEAFLVFYFGLVSIWNLTAMSIIRYLKTCRQTVGKHVTRSRIVVTIVLCYLNSAVWCVAPLLGWGQYGPEPYGISCSISWTCTPLSYIVCLFVFCYGVPIVIMAVCYCTMVKFVRKSESRTGYVGGTRMESRLLKMTVLMCLCFLFAWTPYAVTSLLYVGGAPHVPHLLTVGSPIFAKTSLWYDPLVYFFSVRRFREDLYEVVKGAGSRTPRDVQPTRSTELHGGQLLTQELKQPLGDHSRRRGDSVELQILLKTRLRDASHGDFV